MTRREDSETCLWRRWKKLSPNALLPSPFISASAAWRIAKSIVLLRGERFWALSLNADRVRSLCATVTQSQIQSTKRREEEKGGKGKRERERWCFISLLDRSHIYFSLDILDKGSFVPASKKSLWFYNPTKCSIWTYQRISLWHHITPFQRAREREWD